MPARPWLGFWRGLAAALRSGRSAADPDERRPWMAAARRRRRTLLATVALAALLAAALHLAVAPEDAGALWLLHAVFGTALIAWLGAGFATALMGMQVMLKGDPHALQLADERAPIDPRARTAVIMPICNEDIATVFAGLSATCESVAATGAGRLFDFYLLSDSSDPEIRAAEQRAFERLKAMLGDGEPGAGARLFYRWRRRRTRKKAGNVADWCRRWGRDYRYMVVLDADSAMHGDTMTALVRLMEQHPRAGIVQTLPQAYGHDTLHARVQQFAGRVTGRLFALGMAYWQLGESHYWGHNAILRVEPFMRHCGLAPLPGRGALAGEILSHDFVEAALMRRAGYEVWLAPQLEGSWEQLPANLLDELQRDRRWCRGNLQNARLIAEPGWQPVHRAMFAVGALSYAMAPAWLLFVALGAFVAGGVGAAGALGAWLLTLVLLVLPRVLGAAGVLLARQQRDFGGTWRLAASAVFELAASAVLAPVRMLAHTAFVLGPLTGLKLQWTSPPREAQRIGWLDGWVRVGVFALPLILIAIVSAATGRRPSPQLAMLLLPLLAAVPLTVVGSDVGSGLALRRRRVLNVPDEHRPPRTLVRAFERLATFRGPMPPVSPRPQRDGAFGAGTRRVSAVFATAVCSAFVVAALAPLPVDSPGVPEGTWNEVRVAALMPTVGLALGDEPVPMPRRAAPERPARMIDDETRARALEAVRRALAEEPSPWQIDIESRHYPPTEGLS